MQTIHARNVVLGAGAAGTATAYHLARRGEPVVLVEQFRLGHDRGSSHGAGRITRHSYADVRYAQLMPEAFRAWRELEADAGQNFYLRTGGVSICPPGMTYVAQVTASLDAIGVPHRRMTGADLRRGLPVFQVAKDSDVVFEPDAGILAAARILRAQVDLAKYFGGSQTHVFENLAVRRIDLEADRPTLVTDTHLITADRLAVTAGTWTQSLMQSWPVPLRATRQQVLYFRPKEMGTFKPGQFPVFIVMGGAGFDNYYGMPAHEGVGVKVAIHGLTVVDPGTHDHAIGEDYIRRVRESLRMCLPALSDAPIDHTEVCLYNVAPDDQFQLGSAPGRADVVIASPCSGHGFKFSCLVGRTIADLMITGSTQIPVDAWAPAADWSFLGHGAKK